MNEIDNLPKCLQAHNISTRVDNESNVIAFYTRNSLFSNFNTKFPFKVEGRIYNCPEQYFHRCKALHFGDNEKAEEIMSALDPQKQSFLGKTVRNYNHKSWMEKAKKVLYDANLAKYNQNPEAREKLLATGNATLGEASPSTFWGTGIRLNDRNATKSQFWKGDNSMGKMLMEIRDSLK